VDELVTVTEKEIAKAILRLLEIEKTVVEGLRRLSCSRALKGIWVVRTN
jgi:threonine dehydratase